MIEDFYTSLAVVKQLSLTQTSMGGSKKTFSTRISALECRMTLRPSSAVQVTETDQYGKMTVREVWRLYCAANAANKAIIESDRVEINSKTYEITGIGNSGLLDHHLEIDLTEVR